MPFNELPRRDSWPPTILRIREDHQSENFDTAIDENPFAFFLTSPEDFDDFLDDEDLSAGIETSSKKPVVREISPSSLQRIPIPESDEEEDSDSGIEMPLTLKDFTSKHTSGRTSRTGHHTSGLGLGISFPENASMRGRVRLQLQPEGRTRGRGRARSLSARRPQSWREPSPDIWSIEEEIEDAPERKEITSSPVPEPESTHVMKLAPPPPTRKPKKRVHWAF